MNSKTVCGVVVPLMSMKAFSSVERMNFLSLGNDHISLELPQPEHKWSDHSLVAASETVDCLAESEPPSKDDQAGVLEQDHYHWQTASGVLQMDSVKGARSLSFRPS